MVVCMQLCMSCRRQHSEHGCSSAGRDIPTVHVHLHQMGVMNISHPTQVYPTFPWRCFLRCSTCLWAAAEKEQQYVSWEAPSAGGCLPGKQAARLFLLSHPDFLCGEKNKLHFFLFLIT